MMSTGFRRVYCRMLTFHRRSVWGRPVSAALTVAIALGLASCGESKVSQCNRLAEKVNQTEVFMNEFETEIQSFSQNAADVESLDDIKSAASQYTTAVNDVVNNLDTLATDLQAEELSDQTLIDYRDRYVTVIQGFSSALQDASSAMSAIQTVEAEADLPTQIETSQDKMVTAVERIEALSADETKIINEVNEYCGAVPPADTAVDSDGESATPADATPADATPANESTSGSATN